MTRRFIAKLIRSEPSSRVKHLVGLPPRLTDGPDERMQMQPAAYLVIEENDNETYLFRYSADGSDAGDTWHMNREEAEHQAAFEFEGNLTGWEEVPSDVENVVAFGLAQIRETKRD